ncbi:MAG: 23S rRNA (pseudouridine(1915)-N(3))-methyltransferase RlmH [Clostridiales bacterium]|nr:23S rRNA (pseudouridine(1915)-N(3))-methyltransferase RlmH [Clostridiales bacterium]
MRITIVAVGRLKEKFWAEAVAEYVKRLGRYCQLEIIEAADEATREGAAEGEVRIVKQREGERILSKIRDDGYVVALAIEGRAMDSVEFSNHLSQLGVQGKSHIYFVIGGSLGLSEEVIARADESLSFSRMTFPHQLMRVILLEQLYRACRIANHEPYHK